MKAFTTFFNSLAKHTGLDRDSLVLIATLQNGGPTVSPRGGSDGNVIKRVEIPTPAALGSMPSLWYDHIGTNHCDFKVVAKKGSGKVVIPEFLYGWQHAPFFGNCKIAMNRWVRFGDAVVKPSDALRLAGFNLRAAIAKAHASVLTLVVSTGSSSSAYTAEVHDEYKVAHKNSTHSVLILDLTKHKES